MCPPGQRSHSSADDADVFPSGHVMHDVAPRVEDEYVPGEQAEHEGEEDGE